MHEWEQGPLKLGRLEQPFNKQESLRSNPNESIFISCLYLLPQLVQDMVYAFIPNHTANIFFRNRQSKPPSSAQKKKKKKKGNLQRPSKLNTFRFAMPLVAYNGTLLVIHSTISEILL